MPGGGQRCPCNASRNHGAYVSCVAAVANAFAEEGLISEREKGAAVSQAARSSCGKP